MKKPSRKKKPVNRDHKVLRDALVVLVMQDMKRQIAEGRPGPEILDFDQICSLIEQCKMKVWMVNGNPNYPELVFDPLHSVT